MPLEPLDLSEARIAMMARPRKQRSRRGHDAAGINRLTSDWSSSIASPDQQLWKDLRILRARSRDLAKNDPTAAKFFKMVEANVVGPDGVIFQSKIKNLRGDQLKQKLNKAIEEAWEDWTDRGVCTVDGRFSFLDVQRMFIRTVAMDGECLVRKLKTNANPYGFALQFIATDQLDHTFFLERTRDGNEIRMGVEVDPYQKPVAYYLWNRNPYEWGIGASRERKRVPAEEIIHGFIPGEISQTRGVPWMAPVMFQMQMLKGYQEAEVTAARIGASKMGFYTSELGDEYPGEDRNTDGTIADQVEPGAMPTLPPGMSFTPFDPQHPTTAFPFFVKAMMRSLASGLGVSYNSLAEDLEGVNFSSIRAGLLNERDNWRVLQSWFTNQFLCPVFEAWLEAAVLSNQIELGIYDLDAVVDQIMWHGRRWPWVDPYKDAQANVLAVQNGYSTRTKILGEQGLDFEETIDQLAEEKKYIASKGLVLGTDAKGVADTATDDQNAADSTASDASGN